MSLKISLPNKNENQNRLTKQKENENKYYLFKDFKVQVSQSDFLTQKEGESNKNFGELDDVLTSMNKSNKKMYYLKTVEKKNIINKPFQNILDNIYTIYNPNKNANIYDYIINLETQWETNDKLFLVFDAIKNYCFLDSLIKNNTNNISEENFLIIFRQILESVNILHENNIYGCNLNLNSFIYDIESKRIKLTDLGFSKIFKSKININDSKLKNGFEFSEYTPPEFIDKMDDPQNIKIQDKIKNPYYDIWQLGILFYKIATYGKSPYENAKNEELKKRILAKNIKDSELNKCPPKILQIIDKMLQKEPSDRYSIKQLINIDCFKNYKNANNIPSLMINIKNDSKAIDMNMVNKEKEKIKDIKIDMSTNLEIKNYGRIKDIDKKNEENGNSNNKNLLNNIVVEGNIINDKNIIDKQEIYPEGSVLPSFNKKFLNRFNEIDNDLVINLSNKLALLEKEYKNIDEIKSAIYNITKYISEKIKEKNINDNKDIESFIEKYKSLKSQGVGTLNLFNELFKNKDDFSFEKFKSLIQALLYEISNLDINYEHEKNLNAIAENKIKELEEKNNDLKSEYEEKIKFYEEKIKLLEDVIFNVDNTTMNKTDIINNNKLIYQALTNSIKDFTNVNMKLKQNLEERISKFNESKKSWLDELIQAKKDFRNEISYNLNKTMEQPKLIVIGKNENKETLSKNKKDEKIDELNGKVDELNNLINEQKSIMDQQSISIKNLQNEIQVKEKKIEELNKKLNNLNNK